jgi:hypothetical protein
VKDGKYTQNPKKDDLTKHQGPIHGTPQICSAGLQPYIGREELKMQRWQRLLCLFLVNFAFKTYVFG